MKKQIINTFIVIVLIVVLSCKKQFNPVLNGVSTNYLAVDGMILSDDSTFITLSRTTVVKDTTQFKAELKAIVTIENDQNSLYQLTEKGKGVYVLGITSFDPARKYRLNIKTTNGKVYQSDFVPVKTPPPIDSVYAIGENYDRINFFVNTHDPTNKTRYYRWDYREIWQYFSNNYWEGHPQNFFDYVNGSFMAKNPPIDVTICYGSDRSNQILIASTVNLANDIIKKQPIGTIVSGSQKIEKIYNMQVYQYGLTEEGFNYYQNLKSNTENLGTIFDPQPSFLKGNIHCVTSPTERVVGFVSVSGVTTRMFFVRYNEIPLRIPFGGTYNPTYIGPPDSADCSVKSVDVLYEPAVTFNSRVNSYISGKANPYLMMVKDYVYPNYNTSLPPIGVTLIRRDCADCRLNNHEGTSVTLARPSYFPPY